MFAPPGRRPVAPEKGPRKSTGRASEGFRRPRWVFLGPKNVVISLAWHQVLSSYQPIIPPKKKTEDESFGVTFFVEGGGGYIVTKVLIWSSIFGSPLICFNFTWFTESLSRFVAVLVGIYCGKRKKGFSAGILVDLVPVHKIDHWWTFLGSWLADIFPPSMSIASFLFPNRLQVVCKKNPTAPSPEAFCW